MLIYTRLIASKAFWHELYTPESLTIEDRENLKKLDSIDSIYALNPPDDIDFNNNGVCDPSTAVSITRTVQIKNGKALNQIIYGQSDANVIEITIKAESKGVVTKSPEILVLPIIKDE
jgi:hypothetical protein